jgi:hypothetical protein
LQKGEEFKVPPLFAKGRLGGVKKENLYNRNHSSDNLKIYFYIDSYIYTSCTIDDLWNYKLFHLKGEFDSGKNCSRII